MELPVCCKIYPKEENVHMTQMFHFTNNKLKAVPGTTNNRFQLVKRN